jgi:hypothetical protein
VTSLNSLFANARIALLVVWTLLSVHSSYAQTFQVLHTFSGGEDGAVPDSQLFAAHGKMYGTTLGGGDLNCYFPGGCGALFSLTKESEGWKENTVFHFPGGFGGIQPRGTLVFGSNGEIYGTTEEGGGSTNCYWYIVSNCGVVYELEFTPAGPKETVLHNFNLTPDGGVPLGGLIADSSGHLYGTTWVGGPNTCSCGVVFSLSKTQSGLWHESELLTFSGGSYGYNPQGGLVADSAGNFYGTTSEGGSTSCNTLGCGVIFKLSQTDDHQWKETLVQSFRGGSDGILPAGQLVMGADGSLYGTAQFGDDSGNQCDGFLTGCGLVFKLSPIAGGGWSKTVLHVFTGVSDGGVPNGVALDAGGNVYGTTSAGGDIDACTYVSGRPGCGVVYELSPGADGRWHETVLHTFTGGNDGAIPWTAPILDGDGNLYGTTSAGGNTGACYGYGCGVIFEIER